MRSALLAAAVAPVALLAPAVAPVSLLALAPAEAAPPAPPPPPYIDHTMWAHWGNGKSSLQVYPTPAGRTASAEFVSPNEAWHEVLADSPDANTSGMRAQFVCHWLLAEAAEPGKPSWNLEPWRPVVDDATMFSSGCNPGGPEEPS